MRALAATTGFIVLTDQLTKGWVRARFPWPGDGLTVITGFFDLRYVRNVGAAWGILPGQSLLLIAFSIAALLVLLTGYRQTLQKRPVGWLTLGLLCGGIIGNMIDRIWFGYVIDFLDFYMGQSHFPAFNVADSAICTGVGLYLITQYLADHRSKNVNPVKSES